MMMEFIDYKLENTDSGCFIVICLKWSDSGKHFYIREAVHKPQEIEQVVERWLNQCESFYDVMYQNPN